MDIVTTLIVRGFLLLLGVWMGVGMVAAAVLMLESWKHRNLQRYGTRVVECPMCDGRGAGRWREEAEVCPLCDGESALAERIPELDAE